MPCMISLGESPNTAPERQYFYSSFLLLVVAAVLLNICDTITTWYAVASYGVEAEANPVMRHMIYDYGLTTAMIVKFSMLMLAVALIGITFYYLKTYATAIGLLTWACASTLLIVYNNVFTLVFGATLPIVLTVSTIGIIVLFACFVAAGINADYRSGRLKLSV